MTQVDAVRRRLIETTLARIIREATPLGIFSRETIVDGLVLCDGSIERFNDCYNAWRKLNPTLVAPTGLYERDFIDYVRGEPERLL
jgi:hypothetical protein